MPPKKKKGQQEEKKRSHLGRPGNNLKMGIVGLPNVGKSSLFNCLSGLSVPSENYPFCTIDPSEARVPVPDEKFDFLCKAWKPKNEVPAVLTIFDIAGLVKNASKGEGLGNSFLSNIQMVDAIYHVCRAFSGKSIAHVEGDVDPARDLRIISEELRAKDLDWVETKREATAKIVARGLDKSAPPMLATLEKAKAWLLEGKDIRDGEWSIDDIPVLNSLQLITAKPVVYLANIGNKDWIKKGNKWLKHIKAWVDENSTGAPIIPFSAAWEEAYVKLTPEEKAASETKSTIPKIIRTGYKHLGLINFYTTGEDEVRAWTIQKGWKAPQAAGTIHTSFEKFFIQAEQYHYDDFKELGSEKEVKAAGKNRQQGKNYEVQDGDILLIKHNAGGGGKKKK
jgi:obg-like ATPase 1